MPLKQQLKYTDMKSEIQITFTTILGQISDTKTCQKQTLRTH